MPTSPEFTLLQWGHGDEAVEEARGCEGVALIRFNGATAMKPWKTVVVLAANDRACGASMGPRR